MQKACAITVTTSTEEIATQMRALTLIALFMLRENARIAILMITTSKSVT